MATTITESVKRLKDIVGLYAPGRPRWTPPPKKAPWADDYDSWRDRRDAARREEIDAIVDAAERERDF